MLLPLLNNLSSIVVPPVIPPIIPPVLPPIIPGPDDPSGPPLESIFMFGESSTPWEQELFFMSQNFKVTTKMPPLVELDNDGNSPLNLFDPENNDLAFFNLTDDENIKLSGSLLMIFKYMQGDSTYDDVYLEERNKTLTKEGIECWGHYDPKPVEENLGEFGLELTNEQIFIFNKSYIERRLGRALIAGDVIKPKFQDQKYEVFEVQESEFHGYGVYHLNCHAKLLRDQADVQDVVIVNESPDVGGQT